MIQTKASIVVACFEGLIKERENVKVGMAFLFGFAELESVI